MALILSEWHLRLCGLFDLDMSRSKSVNYVEVILNSLYWAALSQNFFAQFRCMMIVSFFSDHDFFLRFFSPFFLGLHRTTR